METKLESYAIDKAMSIEDKLSALESKAITALEELLGKGKSDNVRLKAAQLILTHKNARKGEGEGQVAVLFNLPEPGMPSEESVEEGNTVHADD